MNLDLPKRLSPSLTRAAAGRLPDRRHRRQDGHQIHRGDPGGVAEVPVCRRLRSGQTVPLG